MAPASSAIDLDDQPVPHTDDTALSHEARLAVNALSLQARLTTTYDFTPFISAPAVINTARLNQGIQVVSIPQATIASPLAPNLPPATLLDLKEFLVGKDGNRLGRSFGSMRRGMEVWKSWKRAWDLWNGWYIEGRINPVWIREEWERRQKKEEEAKKNGGLHEKKRKRGRTGTGHENEDDKNTDTPEGSIGNAETVLPPASPKPPQPPRTWYGEDAHLDQRPLSAPGMKWTPTGRSNKESIPTGRKILRKIGPKSIKQVTRVKPKVKPNQPMVNVSPGQRVPILQKRQIYEIYDEVEHRRSEPYYRVRSWDATVRERQRTGRAIANIAREVAAVEPSGIQTHTVPRRRVQKRLQEIEISREKTAAKGLVNWDRLQQLRSADVDMIPPPVEQNLTDVDTVRVDKSLWLPQEEWYFTGEYEDILEEGTRPGYDMELEEVTENIETQPEVLEDEVIEIITYEWVEILDDRYVPPNLLRQGAPAVGGFGPYANSAPSREYQGGPPWLPELDQANDDHFQAVHNSEDLRSANGSSGGYFAIKDLPDYVEPPVDPDNPDSPIDWDDAIQNSIWRPRRVGETVLKIDLDEDIEDFFRTSDLELDGGVDCGRSPYPVLRPITTYFQTKDGAFKKKKAWDEVTGTIFNMPTTPFEPDKETDDERLIRNKSMYCDPVGDMRLHGWESPDVFPLDIRRVARIPVPESRFEIMEEGDTQIVLPDQAPVCQFRAMSQNDPWWATDEQKNLRDIPARRHPPRPCFDKKWDLLPIDDAGWKEDVLYDDLHHYRYFATNLHGGTLLINGMEVKQGQVAGPLPEFAVIESPGGQISFWWGVGGRNWGQGQEKVNWSRHWEALRAMPGWEFVGMTGGEVWDLKIRDRKERERRGEEGDDDDDDWTRWKRARIEEVDHEANDVSGPLGWVLEPPKEFSTQEDELQWLYAQAQLRQQLGDNAQADIVEESDADQYWVGAIPIGENSASVIDQKIKAGWDAEKANIILKQQTAVQTFAKANQDREKEISQQNAKLSQKRKAEGFELPDPKRLRLDAIEEAKKRKEESDLRKEQAQRNQSLLHAMQKLDKRNQQDSIALAALQVGITSQDELDFIEMNFMLQQKRGIAAQNRRLEEQNALRRVARRPLLPLSKSIDIPGIEAYKKALVERRELAEAAAKVRREEQHNRRMQQEAAQKKTAREDREKERIILENEEVRRRKADDEISKLRLQTLQQQIAQKKRNDDQIEREEREEQARIKRVDETRHLSSSSNEPLVPLKPVPLATTQAQSPLGGSEDNADAVNIWRNTIELFARRQYEKSAAGIRSNQQKGLEQRAQLLGQTPTRYIQDQGFTTVKQYLDAQVLSHDPQNSLKGDPRQRLLDEMRKEFRRALRLGLIAKARAEGTTARVIATAQGYSTPDDYVNFRLQELTLEDIPYDVEQPVLSNRATATLAQLTAHKDAVARYFADTAALRVQNAAAWKALNRKIHEAEGWESILAILPRFPAPPEHHSDGTVSCTL